MAGPSKTVQALMKRKVAMNQIKDVWMARMSIKYKDVQRVIPEEIMSLLSNVNWDEEFLIPGKNTHVCLVVNNIFLLYTIL